MIYPVCQELAAVNKWIKKKVFVNYNGLLQSNCLFIIYSFDCARALCSATFSSTKTPKIWDAELPFITYKFIFSEQTNVFFPTTDINL